MVGSRMASDSLMLLKYSVCIAAIICLISGISIFYRLPSDYLTICAENLKQEAQINWLRQDLDSLYNIMNVSLNENEY